MCLLSDQHRTVHDTDKSSIYMCNTSPVSKDQVKWSHTYSFPEDPSNETEVT